MLKLDAIHHIAIICSDYKVTKNFYTNILGFEIMQEHYREERQSWKLDLKLGNHYVIEIFSFVNPPKRITQPEACGLRHLAFEVSDIEMAIAELKAKNVITEPIRIDTLTGKRFTFFSDPDGLPLELYEK
jgi:glyoxylase I family protein